MKELRYSLQFAPFLEIEAWNVLYKKGNFFAKAVGIVKGYLNRMVLMFGIWKYDYVFIHREAAPLGPPVFEWIIAKLWRKKIIYDFDDAIWLHNTSDNNRLAARLKWHRKVSDICKWSYKISCGNRYLADYASKYHSRVKINPTTIDTENLHNPDLFKPKEPKIENLEKLPVVGWTGSHSTLSYLKLIEPALQYLQQKHAFVFRVISNQPPDITLRNLEYVPWNKATEMEDLSVLDIGLMPLQDDIWAKGKCGFKCLQYMALGIPALVSPVGVNNQIIDDGENGFFCQTEQDWINHIESLLQNEMLRKKIGQKGREKVESQFSVISNKVNYLDLFT